MLGYDDKVWLELQNVLNEKTLHENAKKAAHQLEYMYVIMTKCKAHGGLGGGGGIYLN